MIATMRSKGIRTRRRLPRRGEYIWDKDKTIATRIGKCVSKSIRDKEENITRG